MINQREANSCREDNDASARIHESEGCGFESRCLQKIFSQISIEVKLGILHIIPLKGAYSINCPVGYLAKPLIQIKALKSCGASIGN